MTAAALRTELETPPLFPSRLPEREKLREAIARRDTAEARLSKIRDAQARGIDTSSNLFAAIKAAKAAVAEAEASEGSYLAACAINQTGTDASPSKAASERLAQLEADYSHAKRTQAALETAAEAAERALTNAKDDVAAAVRVVVEADSATEQLIESYRAAQSAYFDKCAQLTALSRAGVSVLSQWGTGFNPQYQRHYVEPQSALRWLAAVERLKADADAQLPTS